MLSFLPLINNSVIIRLKFLLLSTSAIIPSNMINFSRFLPDLYTSIFYKYDPYNLSIQEMLLDC